MTEESFEERFYIAEENLNCIESDISEWAEKYKLTLFTDTPIPNRLRYLLRNIDHQHQQVLESHSLQLKQANQASNNRINYFEAELIKANRELKRIKKQQEEFLLNIQFWVEACGDGLTHREKNERIRKAIDRMIKAALPTDDDF